MIIRAYLELDSSPLTSTFSINQSTNQPIKQQSGSASASMYMMKHKRCTYDKVHDHTDLQYPLRVDEKNPHKSGHSNVGKRKTPDGLEGQTSPIDGAQPRRRCTRDLRGRESDLIKKEKKSS